MPVQHTSGPWIARRWWEQAEMDLTAADADERQEWQDAPYKDIYSPSAGVTVMACHDLSEVSPMDARVLAASPDLLAVLEEFVEDVETSYQHSDEFPDGDALEMLRVEWPDLAITYEKAVKAIALAKGGKRWTGQ